MERTGAVGIGRDGAGQAMRVVVAIAGGEGGRVRLRQGGGWQGEGGAGEQQAAHESVPSHGQLARPARGLVSLTLLPLES
jgi:hypothetical protein